MESEQSGEPVQVEVSKEDDKEIIVQPEISIEERQVNQEQLNQENKRQWEDGRVDWMGQHQSDRIIDRLKHLIKK